LKKRGHLTITAPANKKYTNMKILNVPIEALLLVFAVIAVIVIYDKIKNFFHKKEKKIPPE